MEIEKQICNLSKLKIGQSGVILEIQEHNREIKRHLLDMGITQGTKVKVKKIAPLGNPIDIELRGYDLVICAETLKNIIVRGI